MSAFVVRTDTQTAAGEHFAGSPLAGLLPEMSPVCGIVYGAMRGGDCLGGRMTMEVNLCA